MNSYKRINSELTHYNPYRTKENQFASKDNYDHLVGDLPAEVPEKTKTKETSTINTEVVSKASKDVLGGVKSLSESTSKLLEGSAKTTKKYSKYPNMTDAELNAKLNRLSMEQRYSDLLGETKSIKNGSEKAKDVLQTVGAVAGIGVSIATIAAAIYAIKSGKGGTK